MDIYANKPSFRFKNLEHYEGETIFGGCGYMNRIVVFVLKRTKGYIVYQDKWGKRFKAKRHFHKKCEFFIHQNESFYADSMGMQMSFLIK